VLLIVKHTQISRAGMQNSFFLVIILGRMENLLASHCYLVMICFPSTHSRAELRLAKGEKSDEIYDYFYGFL